MFYNVSMNKLKNFLSRRRGSQRELARFLGAHQPDVSKWCAGHPVPVRYCKKIEFFTHGEITVRDLRPDDWRFYWPEQEPATTGKEVY